MEIIPGRSFGGFLLGMSICDACFHIMNKTKLLSHVDIKYGEEDPILQDVVLDLRENGFMLRFDPRTQQLKAIEVYDVPKLTLSYAGSIFGSADKAPTLVTIYEKFGPTHPGEYNSDEGLFHLNYPGLSFVFIIPRKYEESYKEVKSIPPMEFPDGTTPLCSRIIIYTGTKFYSPDLPTHVPAKENNFYFDEVLVHIGEGISFTNRKVYLEFDCSTQDVLSALGPPSRIFYKEEDKMKIHTSEYNGLGCHDYFYNYFGIGIDILFDAQSHTIKKFILHTNFPTHHEFNVYMKCNFKILLKSQEDVITADTKWNEIQAKLGKHSNPVVHNGASTINPFGPTLFYGYSNGVIFEVMNNNHIASVSLWRSPPI